MAQKTDNFLSSQKSWMKSPMTLKLTSLWLSLELRRLALIIATPNQQQNKWFNSWERKLIRQLDDRKPRRGQKVAHAKFAQHKAGKILQSISRATLPSKTLSTLI